MRNTNNLRLELNVLNLFNQKTARHQFNLLNRNRSAASINLANQDLKQPYDYKAMIAATTDGRNGIGNEPRYGMQDLWSEGTTAHFMVKFLF